MVVSDATVEAMAAVLADNPRGVLNAWDELSGWLGGFDRYATGNGSSDASAWLSMHDGETLIVDRKTGQRVTIVPLASVSITGGIQPAILARGTARTIAREWTSGSAADGVSTAATQAVEG